MLGDVLLITDNHRKAAEQIVSRLGKSESDKVVIAIGGESGAGKSELAHVVSRRLKERGELAKILHIDNYYKVSPAERAKSRMEHGIESIGLSEINWYLLGQHIDGFRESKEAVLSKHLSPAVRLFQQFRREDAEDVEVATACRSIERI